MTEQEQVIYETGLAAPTAISNLDGGGLRILWDVTRTRSSKTDFGEVTLINLSPPFRRQVYALWQTRSSSRGFRMGLHTGWGGVAHLVMSGTCWNIQPEVRSGQDVLTIFRFGEGQQEIVAATTNTPKAYTYEGGDALGLWLTIQDMFFQLGLRVDPSMQPAFMSAVRATPIAASGSWVLTGEITDTIGDMLDTFGLEWKVYAGQVIFLRRGVTASAVGELAAVLSPSTGLLGWTPTDSGGIECTALAQAAIRPGTQIIVQDGFGISVGAPGFRVETVRFFGDTNGVSVMAIAALKSTPV
jgi:hypothetical protein